MAEFDMSVMQQGARLRRSPFYEATQRYGPLGFTVYNHMLFPIRFADLEAEYWHLLGHVSLWDVAVERNLEISGPDARAGKARDTGGDQADLDLHGPEQRARSREGDRAEGDRAAARVVQDLVEVAELAAEADGAQAHSPCIPGGERVSAGNTAAGTAGRGEGQEDGHGREPGSVLLRACRRLAFAGRPEHFPGVPPRLPRYQVRWVRLVQRITIVSSWVAA